VLAFGYGGKPEAAFSVSPGSQASQGQVESLYGFSPRISHLTAYLTEAGL
jgi:hypothetical protein